MPNVVVLGNSAIDLITRVKRFPSLDSHVDADEIRPSAGGKGLFQAVGCRKLGCFTTFVTSLGQDTLGQGIKRFLNQEMAKNTGPMSISTDPQYSLLIHELPADFLGARLTTSIVYVIFDTNPVATPASGFAPSKKASYTGYNVVDPGLADFIQANAEQEIKASHAVLVSFDMDQRSIEMAVHLANTHNRPLILHASPPRAIPLELVTGAKYVIMTKREALDWLRLVNVVPEAQTASLSLEKIGEPFLRVHRALTLILIEENDNCVVIDRSGVRRYAAYPVESMIGFNGVRSAFCAAIAFKVADSIANSTTLTETDLISFGAAAIRHCRVNTVNAATLPDTQALQGIITGFKPVSRL